MAKCNAVFLAVSEFFIRFSEEAPGKGRFSEGDTSGKTSRCHGNTFTELTTTQECAMIM